MKNNEVNFWSVAWGVLMAVLFSAAAAYLGLKVGQVFEAAIPIAIIAVGVSAAAKRSNALRENVIIQSIGACSGAVVAGAIFTLPAIYILQAKYPEMSADFLKIFIASLLGGVLGILFLIPFRRYFVEAPQEQFPFPEATATTQVLKSGASEAPTVPADGGSPAVSATLLDASASGASVAGTSASSQPSALSHQPSQARPLLIAGLVGGLYDFIVATFGWWNENVTSRMIPFGDDLAEKAKLVFKNNTGAAVLGLGYIIGFRYALIITLGSLFVWWLVVPGMALLFGGEVLNQWNPAITTPVGEMSPEQIFTSYGKSIGIGAIAMAGIIGIIKSWGVIKSAIGLATKAGASDAPASGGSPAVPASGGSPAVPADGGSPASEATVPDGFPSGVSSGPSPDLPFRFIAIASVVTLILTFLFFWFGVMDGNLLFAAVAIILTAVIAFLFTTVAANAIAIVGSNPVSGMTLMTLILASVVMVAVGLKGTGGMVAALIMGGVVCTALSMAGSFITDLKIGYWCGTEPRKQQTWKFLGTLVSAATVGGVMMLLNETYGFASGALAAPQANAMAAVIDPLMNGVGAPWPLYAIGAVIAVVLTLCKVPALAFALGMFIPMELNVPLVIGGAISWYVTSRSKDETTNKARGEKGNLIASGFIAGGALMGVISALLRFGGIQFDYTTWWTNPLSELCSLVAYILLILYFIRATKPAHANN